jgi:ABC-type microcin C transport system permease subunit YejB
MIPNSIADITTDRQNDPFVQKTQIELIDHDRIAALIKQQLSIDLAKKFDEGFTFYKPSVDYKSFLKNTVTLFFNAIITSSKKNITDDNERQAVVSLYEGAYKTIANLLETVISAADKMTKEENNIDVQSISCILQGYATDTLKRAHYHNDSKGQ